MKPTTRQQQAPAASPEARLLELGIELPPPPEALGQYTPVHIVGDLLYTSGVLPSVGEGPVTAGVVGDSLSLAEGAEAARLCALNILSLVQSRTGSLDSVRQIVQIVGFVRSSPRFVQQGKVLNGASELLVEIFGEKGRHTRTALGTSELPQGAAVEMTAVIRIYPDMIGHPVMGHSTTP
jgi:enamine deaminase RidA (YjgF/YER057c/UK114 family)